MLARQVGNSSSPLLKIADTFASFQAAGKTLELYDYWNRDVNTGASSVAASWRFSAEIKSGLHALSGLMGSSCLLMPDTEKQMSGMSLNGEPGMERRLSSLSFTNTLWYCLHRASTLALSEVQTRLSQNRAGIPMESHQSIIASTTTPFWLPHMWSLEKGRIWYHQWLR